MIRQHSHIRYWKKQIPGLPELEGWGVNCTNTKWGCYKVELRNQKHEQHSRINAKDIITPFTKSGNIGKFALNSPKDEDFPKFIVSKDIKGVVIKETPITGEFLTPIYFNPKVLSKYYTHPAIYSVGFHSPGYGGISYMEEWSLPLGRNKDGYIIAWLGDFKKSGMHYEDLVHWASYSIPPIGKMAEDFWNGQMENKVSDIPSIESKFIEIRQALNKHYETTIPLFREFTGPDVYVEKLLRIPLFDDQGELKDSVLNLSIMFLDTINKLKLEETLPKEFKIDKTTEKALPPIQILNNYLRIIIKLPESTVDPLIQNLRNLNLLRSKAGIAHSFSDSGYLEVIKKLNLEGQQISAKKLFLAVAEPLANSLNNLCKQLQVNLWWLKTDESK